MKFLGVLASVVFFYSANSVFSIDISNNILLPGGILPSNVNVSQYPGEKCNRKCIKGEKQRICYFEFIEEHYQTMGVACKNCANGQLADCDLEQCVTADGVERGFLTINRQLPAPAIHVCQNDIIVVDLVNHMSGLSSTIHWHGQHQRKTPYMDGVPFVTQCPNHYHNTFRYIFEAANPGTHFYHSHSGLQKVDGHFGALIVRRPIEDDPQRNEYDYDLPEHYILMADWFDLPADMWNPGLPTRKDGIEAASMLINGRSQRIGPLLTDRTNVPLTRYFVEQNKRYRFRIINSGSDSCPFQLQIENHRLAVLSTDSYDVQPRIFDTLISNSGERYDVRLTADQPVGDYLVRARQIGSCVDKPLEAFAILSYRRIDGTFGTPTPPIYTDNYPAGTYLNHPNATCFQSSTDICITELRALEEDPILRNIDPLYTYFLGFDNYPLDNNRVFAHNVYEPFMNLEGDLTLIGAVNNLSFTFPPFPLLTQPEDVPTVQFCNDNNRPTNCPYGEICVCTHLIKVPLNVAVELIIVDETATIRSLNHPFHLHGGRVMVTDMGQNPYGTPMTVQIAKDLHSINALQSTPFNPYAVWKDTVSIPSRGYVKIRYWADNPGVWLLHCHYDWHMATGMALVIQVGEFAQMKRPPPGFPRCNNYKPNIVEVLGQYVIP